MGRAGEQGRRVFSYMAKEDSVDEFIKYHVENIGIYLEDQDLLRQYAAESYATLERFDTWSGGRMCRDASGDFTHERFYPWVPWSLTAAELDMLLPIHRRAKKLGVEFIDKTTIVDLLTDAGRAVGAVGFSLLTGPSISSRPRRPSSRPLVRRTGFSACGVASGVTAKRLPIEPARR